jgi:hypothetical protein
MSDDADNLEAIAKGTAEGLLKPFGGLITALFGPAAQEAGLILRDRMRMFRASRTQRFFETTQEMFEKQQVEPQPIPPKLLFAILENATLEDNDDLQDRWAMLLVNSCSPRGKDLLPSAPEILKQLNPWEVMLLQRCYNALTMKGVYPYPHPEDESQGSTVGGWVNDLRFKHGFDTHSMGYNYDFAIMSDNLLRLGLLRRKELPEGKVDVVLTTLGYKFIELCQVEYKGPRK